MSKYSQALIYTHAWLSSTLWPIGMFEIDCKSKIHRQTDWILRSDATFRRTARRTSLNNQLFKKVRILNL